MVPNGRNSWSKSATLVGLIVTVCFVAICALAGILLLVVQPDAPDGGSLADLVERVENTVVQVRTSAGISGSGFLLKDDVVVTNRHVIQGAETAEVTFKDGTTSTVSGILDDERRDLALLRITPPNTRYRPLRLAAGVPRAGDSVVALGAPLGLSFSVSEGVVSAVRALRDLPGWTEEKDLEPDLQLVQTTAPTSRGNSGGPLVNMQGEVVGVNTLGLASGQNLNFAVSAREIETACARLTEDEFRPLASIVWRNQPSHNQPSRNQPSRNQPSRSRENALTWVKSIEVVVEEVGGVAAELGLQREDLQSRIEDRLQAAGIPVVDMRYARYEVRNLYFAKSELQRRGGAALYLRGSMNRAADSSFDYRCSLTLIEGLPTPRHSAGQGGYNIVTTWKTERAGRCDGHDIAWEITQDVDRMASEFVASFLGKQPRR